MFDYWWIIALICSLFSAVYIYSNQIFKMHGQLLMVYRGIGSAVLLLPFMPLFSPVENWEFYALCTVQGCLIGFNDGRFLRSAKAFGAEITSAVQPLSIGIIFILWLALKPAQLLTLLHEPLRFGIIILCITAIIISIFYLRSGKTSRKAFAYLAPCVFALAVNDIVNKEAMLHGREQLVSAIYYYNLITSFVAGSTNLSAYLRRHGISQIFVKKNIFDGLGVIILVTIVVVAKNLAMLTTPNPAYASAIIFLYPLWITGANNLYEHLSGGRNYQRVDLKLLLLLLAAVTGLIVFGQS